MLLQNVTLELSSKPFVDDSEKTMYEVGEKLFLQWKNLTDRAEKISVMLWIADGSEILTYSGNLEQTFEWAYWQGFANPAPHPEHPTDLDKRSFFLYPTKYLENQEISLRSYAWLKRMIEVLRECCLKINGKPLRVIATFDNGPEFAVSEFKYKTHPEVCGGKTATGNGAVICNSTLHADNRRYAAFPDGIPEGITLGKFFGAQFREFAKDTGFEAIWLSNGMGFGRDPWGVSGFLFDKVRFHPEEAPKARETMLQFWNDFTKECPGMCIETRGSNYSAGVEMATDGAPLRELYDDFKIAPPVNSPWAALNYNTGLEIAAWMTHIARLPDTRFPYRFYPHDPWFLNSPWLDRYEREPWDIYLPLSVGRMDSSGSIQTPNSINLLTVDDSRGQLPEQVPMEVIPHLLDAFCNAPDSPAPFVWVYPFRQYYDMVHKEKRPDIVLNEDLFIGETIQAGFPLNTVAELENFDTVPLTAVVVMPVSAYSRKAADFLDKGGRIVFYGALVNAPEDLKARTGLRCGEGVSGKQHVILHHKTDTFRHGDYADVIYVHDVFDGGPLTEIAEDAEVLAEAGGRVLVSVKGNAAFIRSILPMPEHYDVHNSNMDYCPPDRVFPVETLLRSVVSAFGWTLEFSAFSAQSMLPRMNICRHDGMFFFNVFARDTTAAIKLRTPLGVPLLESIETEISGGCAILHPPKCWHKRCRMFVEQAEDGVLSKRLMTAEIQDLKERFQVEGLKNAVVRIFLNEKDLQHLELVNNDIWHYLSQERMPYTLEDTEFGKCAVVRNVSGCLVCGVLNS